MEIDAQKLPSSKWATYCPNTVINVPYYAFLTNNILNSLLEDVYKHLHIHDFKEILYSISMSLRQ